MVEDGASAPRDLNQRIQESKGLEIKGLLGRLEGSRYMVERNYKEVHAAGHAYDGKKGIWLRDDPTGAREVHRELLRCLHNYLASLFSLYEHADTYQGRLDDPELEQEIAEKVSELDVGVRGDFLKGLRHFIQHREQLPVMLQEQMDLDHDAGEVSIERSLFLSRDEMLKFDGWPNRRTRDYINGMDEQIHLLDELDRYQEDITELYDWLDARIRERYAEELEDLAAMIRVLHEQ